MKDEVLIDSLLQRRNDFRIARTAIIASMSAIAAIAIGAVAVSAYYARQASNIEHIIDNRGNFLTVKETDRTYYDIMRYRAAAANGLLLAFTHNEETFTGNMDKASYFFDKTSYERIENEYITEKRLGKLKLHDMTYTLEIADMKNDVLIEIGEDGKATGYIKAVQYRRRKSLFIKIQIEASFSIYDTDPTSNNLFAAKIADFAWTEKKIKDESK